MDATTDYPCNHCWHANPVSTSSANALSEVCCWCGIGRTTSMTTATHAVIMHGSHEPKWNLTG